MIVAMEGIKIVMCFGVHAVNAAAAKSIPGPSDAKEQYQTPVASFRDDEKNAENERDNRAAQPS
jgi:hypothetical protein